MVHDSPVHPALGLRQRHTLTLSQAWMRTHTNSPSVRGYAA